MRKLLVDLRAGLISVFARKPDDFVDVHIQSSLCRAHHSIRDHSAASDNICFFNSPFYALKITHRCSVYLSVCRQINYRCSDNSCRSAHRKGIGKIVIVGKKYNAGLITYLLCDTYRCFKSVFSEQPLDVYPIIIKLYFDFLADRSRTAENISITCTEPFNLIYRALGQTVLLCKQYRCSELLGKRDTCKCICELHPVGNDNAFGKQERRT